MSDELPPPPKPERIADRGASSPAEVETSGAETSGAETGGAERSTRPRRRRGSRGGVKHSGSSTGSAAARGAERSSENPELPDLPWEGVPGGRGESSKVPDVTVVPGHAPRVGDSRPAPTVSPVEVTPTKQQRPPKQDSGAKQDRPSRSGQPVNRERRQKLAQQKSQAVTPSDDVVSAQTDTPNESTPVVEPSGSSVPNGAKARNRRTGNRDTRQKRTRINPNAQYTMCVHVRSNATQIAVLEGRSLIEHYVSHAEDDVSQIHGNIYLGKVQNVLPGMEAAFVDIATPKNAVLYRGDVQFDRKDLDSPAEFKDSRIEQLLKNGQLVVCQVTKNPIAAKGARLTQEVSLAGRFVVLVPNSSTFGISKRLPDDERKRLRGVLDQVKPAHHGIIVRTAASGADADELRRDVQSLVKHWDEIATRAAKLRGPALLHREPNLAVRIIREEFSAAYQRVVIDDPDVYAEVRRYVESITPELADRIELFDTTTEPLPVFEQFHVHEQLHKAIDRKVWLPSGGSIIIERTEALTVIDVNTGKNVGSTSLEETVYKNNLEAATEIARQLRLRDIGGIIVIDFIDMEIKPNRGAVVAHFREELSKDKTRTQVFEISELGLVEMTRKRISEGLIEALSDVCPTCNGRGFVFDPTVLEE
jgi:ribonuclease E